ncbi:DNA translocase FtsK [Gracilibacillus sp. YIM 98692]|uniref:DNA translocase FtsK n=1 Tax=Gracilibacillus sp. YIM 98692 TaxID=2663532 RepID=UPI0013D05405|nr:DNA translocase FtsK [Gracilibacillus sp. YIM 98692]
MARKKKSKKKKQTLKKNIKIELYGILFVFLAIFGSGASMINEGAVSSLLEYAFRFFLGFWFFIVSLILLYVGIYLMIKRNWPNLLSRRWVSAYLIVSGILLLTHYDIFTSMYGTSNNYPSIVRETLNFYTDFVKGERDASFLGGGMVGAILYAISFYLFSHIGAQIVAFFIIGIGLMTLMNISIGDILSNLWTKVKKRFFARYKQWKENKQIKKQTKQEEEALSEEKEVTIELNNGAEADYPSIAYASNEMEYTEEAKSESPPEHKETPKVDTEEDTYGESDQESSESLPTTVYENIDYQLPRMDMLEVPKMQGKQQEKSYIQRVVRKLEKTFQSFGVKARVTKVHVGPSVTKYEVYPEAGVKVSKIVNLHDDLALALAAKDIRIEAPIPGKSAVGIEVPNEETAMVTLREVLESKQSNPGNKLSFALGKDISGDPVIAELNKMPHLLVAGATGSGKSVCINGIITSILMRAKPHEVKMMMIDPKKVELNVYNGIPHLLTPVVTDPKKAARALKKVVAEMERRYDLFSETGTRNIEGYNDFIVKHNQDEEDEQPQLPYVVVIVDELADLMMVASNEVEDAITRLAQMARAAGIHLIIATQRPSVDVITGVIKANIPSRIAFSVSSQTDSRTILDSGGAEKLLGRGDMLFIPVGLSKPVRIQGAFLSDDEVEGVVDHCIEQQKAQYQDEMIPEEESEVVEEVDDDLYDEAVQLILEMQSASVSMLQRRFRIGYTRAARLIDAMESRGIVGPYEGSKPRTVLQSKSDENATVHSSSSS